MRFSHGGYDLLKSVEPGESLLRRLSVSLEVRVHLDQTIGAVSCVTALVTVIFYVEPVNALVDSTPHRIKGGRQWQSF